MKGILGRKVGMTSVFTKDGKIIPVTVISAEPNVVMQVKTVEKDGYDAIQLGVVDKKENRANKSELGRAKKANTTPKRFLKEIKGATEYNVGDKIGVDTFNVGEIVDVTGTSKGKGTQGVIKRHNQSRGPMGHGSHYHRGPGSMGTMLPKRVLKGKNLPGHMGVETVTIQNLEIVEVNTTDNYILVSGNVPGAKNSLVFIKEAVKKSRKENPKEILSYEEETVVDNVIEVKDEVAEEEVTENETDVNDAVEETVEEDTNETEEVTPEESKEA
jgi:large subunit ribosomal protein L3